MAHSLLARRESALTLAFVLGKLYSDYLPAPAASSPRELTAVMHSPTHWGLDYFLMGKKKKPADPKSYEGFLLMFQPLSYFIAVARVKKRSSRCKSPRRIALRRLKTNSLLSAFTSALARMRKKVEGTYGRVRSLETDEDTRLGDRAATE